MTTHLGRFLTYADHTYVGFTSSILINRLDVLLGQIQLGISLHLNYFFSWVLSSRPISGLLIMLIL